MDESPVTGLDPIVVALCLIAGITPIIFNITEESPVAKTVLIPHHLTEDFESEKKIAIENNFGEYALSLMKAPSSNRVYEFSNRSYIGTITFYFERTSSTFHYDYSPMKTTGAKFLITKDWRD